LLLKDILATAGLPKGSWAILPASREVADPLITDPRISLLSFTGSPDVGWDMKQRAGKKKVVLELGGNAACIVDETSDLDIAIPKIVAGAFTQAGQSCISVQRVYIHESRFEAAMIMLTGLAKQFKIGPLISKSAADRLTSWINNAIATGAMCHCGAQQDGAYIQPTILSQVPQTSPLACQEAFGPVMCVTPFTDFNDALTAVNDSPFGLQAGLFTTLMSRAHQAFETLDVGGLIIQDVPALRFDHMPYGGIKDSGFGREGIRYAILEDYTYEKILVY
jgi:acyl-CoA reductase-like NAD-dependent aldehyde dehydrogenase